MNPGILRRALVAAVLAAVAGMAMLFMFGSRIPGAVALAMAAVTAVSGFAAPRVFLAMEKFNMLAVRAIGVALTWVLLTGLYWIYFVPGRLVVRALGKDPLTRKFRDNRRTYWEPCERSRGRDSYRRQY
jgi:hypothetical protein